MATTDNYYYEGLIKDILKSCKEFCLQGEKFDVDSNGEIIIRGELGDIKQIEQKGKYLILKKPKFTQKEKDIINYYIKYIFTDDYSDDNKKDAFYVNPLQLLLCDSNPDISDILNSPFVSEGNYIDSDPEKVEYQGVYCKRDPYNLDTTLYAVYSIMRKRLIIPFQPCKVYINPIGFPCGIYLANEEDIRYFLVGTKYEAKMNKNGWGHFLDNDQYVPIFNGQVFHSIFDTFCFGKYVGQSLLSVFKKSSKNLFKLIIQGKIFIDSFALKQLDRLFSKSNEKTIKRLIIHMDSKFEFEKEEIHSITEKIVGHAFYYGMDPWVDKTEKIPMCQDSYYAELTINEILDINPEYVFMVIKNKINVDIDILDGIDKKASYYIRLRNCIKECQEEKQREEKAMWCQKRDAEWEEMQRYFTGEGYRGAFENDPDAEWNTD